MSKPSIDRRRFLRASGLAAMGLGTPAALSRPELWMPGRPARKATRVILVAFAGGVRTRETIGAPDNVPNLMRMAAEGVLYTRARTANLGHFGATMSLFTGIAEPRGIRENSRGSDPTLFEYVRKDLGLAANDVWISTSGGAQQANYSYGLHPDYGPEFGANALDGDGLFNREFRSIVESLGTPRALDPKESELLGRLRRTLSGETDSDGALLSEHQLQVERYLLDELTSGTSDLRGRGASDAKALRVARNLLAVFRPRLLSVVLRDADVAHGSFNAYVEVLRRNDEMLGELWRAVQEDPELAGSTAIFVVPEFGRDADLNSRRGLDHGDGSEDLNYVSLVAWGPDFRRGETVNQEVRTIDVCSNVCQLFGAKAKNARGKRLPKLYA